MREALVGYSAISTSAHDASPLEPSGTIVHPHRIVNRSSMSMHRLDLLKPRFIFLAALGTMMVERGTRGSAIGPCLPDSSRSIPVSSPRHSP